MEVSHGCGIGARALGYPGLVEDEELLEAAVKAAPNLKFSIFVAPFSLALAVIPGLLDFFQIGRVGVNLKQISDSEKFIQKLKKYDKEVSVQLVGSHARPPEVVAKAAKQVEEMGADIIYLVDTFGSMKPDEVTNYVNAIRTNTKAKIGFHSHNNLGWALPNTLAAWEAGASWLDASLMGVGRGAGNTILETLVFELQKRGQVPGIKLKELCEATKLTVLPVFINPPLPNYLDLLFALEKTDFFGRELFELSASMLHVPLADLVSSIHNKMGDEIIANETHLKAILEEEGIDLDKIISALKGPQKPKAPKNS